MKEITGTCGSATRAAPTSAPPGSTWNNSSGRPASAKIAASESPPQTAVRGSGLRTTPLPSASAGATERMERISGALKGAITPTTPTGMRRVYDSRGASVGSTWPAGREARAAAS